MERHFRAFIPALLIAITPWAWATLIHVPGDQPSIQAGITAAAAGDTVLVDPGRYYENIHFRGKGIVVASLFLPTGNPGYVDSTIIDGSAPADPDSASCVRIVGDSAATAGDTSAALIGFTITGGQGTIWNDEHGAGLYREGGGILIQYLSPRIRFNVINGNHATNTQGCSGAGGGAIRCGDGDPRITNNVIMRNAGGYGGAIVLNYTGAVVANNVIAYDSAAGAYGGGGGIWVYSTAAAPRIIENNVIAYNVPGGSAQGGGLRLWSTSGIVLRNNIIWGNINQQINATTSSVTVRYNDVQNGYSGEGNIDLYPAFTAGQFYLSDSSPAIDAGDTNAVLNDPEDQGNPGHALWPARGLLRNDMGAYGGPASAVLPAMPLTVAEANGGSRLRSLTAGPNPFRTTTGIRWGIDAGDQGGRLELMIYDRSGRRVRAYSVPGTVAGLSWDGHDDQGRAVPDGVYLACLTGRGIHSTLTVVVIR